MIICDLPSAEYVRSRLSYDPFTGELRWKYNPTSSTSWNAKHAGKIAGTVSKRDNARRISIDRRWFLSHRLIWLIVTGEDPKVEIDHRNVIRSDNRWENLRLASSSDNKCNRPKRIDNTTGAKGIWCDKRNGKLRAEIVKNGRKYRLGGFDTMDEARAAYRKAAFALHGEFMPLNLE